MPPPCLCSLARPTAFLFLRFLPPFLEVTARTSTKMRILQQAAQKGSLVTQQAEPEDVSYLPFVNVAECSTLPLQARPSRSKALKRLAARIRRSCPFWRHALVPFLATGAAQKMATGAAVGPLQHGDRRCRRAFASLRRRQRLSPKPRTPVARAQQRHFHFSVCTHKSWRRGNTWDRNTFLRKSNVPYGV